MKIFIINLLVLKNNIFFSLSSWDGLIIFKKSIKSILKFNKKVSYQKFSYKNLNTFFQICLDFVVDFDKSFFYYIYINTSKKFFSNIFIYNFLRSKLNLLKIISVKPIPHGFMRKKKLRRL